MKALMRHTSQAYFISLNVITKNNGNANLTPINLIQLTHIIFALWSIRQTVNRQIEIFQIGIDSMLDLCELFYVSINEIRTKALYT